MVTHVTDVKPLATVVVYSDPTTGNEVYQEVSVTHTHTHTHRNTRARARAQTYIRILSARMHVRHRTCLVYVSCCAEVRTCDNVCVCVYVCVCVSQVVGRQFSSLETTKTWQRKPKKGAVSLYTHARAHTHTHTHSAKQ